MYYFVYETTNLINDKKYRGIHKTNNLEDGYLGSGLAFVKAVKKYGKENFERKIIEFCDSYDELLEKEKIWVDIEWVKLDSNYNIKTGGQSAGILSEESKNKISQTLKEKYANGEISVNNVPRTFSDEEKQAMSSIQKEIYKNNEEHTFKKYKEPWNKGKKGVQIPWNKGLKGAQVAWNKGLKQPITEERREKLKCLEPWNKGKKGTQIPWNKGKEMPKVECPYCGKLTDKLNAKKWHFDNCKLKN